MHNNGLHYERYIHRMEQMIKANTFLGEDNAWEEFCSWFQVYLTEWVLEELESTLGSEKVHQLSSQELNNLFYQQITKNLASY
ncbi:Transcriptional regulator OS=Lysinibacillus sphaericus OX=1421 GN=LS41612_12075 PE=4 SV=1 [Lysinibacillus sphaericus]